MERVKIMNLKRERQTCEREIRGYSDDEEQHREGSYCIFFGSTKNRCQDLICHRNRSASGKEPR